MSASASDPFSSLGFQRFDHPSQEFPVLTTKSLRLLALFGGLFFRSLFWEAAPATAAPPNIIFILADDIGYGDLGCYGAEQIRTPNCDALARAGLRFTDAHAPAAVCTPTRYAFMTGEYAWRRPGTGILPGTAGLIIEPGRTTVPALLKRVGYQTGVFGKWHLGLGTTPTDYNGEIRPGPLEIGFDEAWILPATGDRTPCVWVENRRVVGLDPADPISLDYSVKRGEPRSFVRGIPRIGGQTGGAAALWKDDEIADVIAAKSVDFIERQVARNDGRPFFLYLCTHDIHVPRVPHERFRGSSTAGVRGDAVHSFDWTVGQVLGALERLKIADDTLVILTSDNGGVLDPNGPDEVNAGTVETNNGHPHNGPLRGDKGSCFEGGTRVPFILRWPARVKPGTSGALVCHIDMLHSLATLTGQTLTGNEGPDSFDLLSDLLGENNAGGGRTTLVEQAGTLALREGTWKLVPAQKMKKKTADPQEQTRSVPQPQLYQLATDLGEEQDVAREHPERVRRMLETLEQIQSQGRSRP
jgi:arylsulfatase A-like enzyme